MAGPPPRGAWVRPARNVGGPPLYASYGLVAYGVAQVVLSLGWVAVGALTTVGLIVAITTGPNASGGAAEALIVACMLSLPTVGQLLCLAFGVVAAYGGRVMFRGGSANAVRVGAVAAILGPLVGVMVAASGVMFLSCVGFLLLFPALAIALVGAIAGVVALYQMSELLTEEEPDYLD